jgi:hypothetical protein
MVPPRHRIPTPAWAELPTDATGSDTFQPFVTRAFASRPATPFGSAAFGACPEAQPILRDDDSDAPKVSPF